MVCTCRVFLFVFSTATSIPQFESCIMLYFEVMSILIYTIPSENFNSEGS